MVLFLRSGFDLKSIKRIWLAVVSPAVFRSIAIEAFKVVSLTCRKLA